MGRPPAPKRKIVVRKYAIFPRESLKSYDANNYSRNQFFEMLYLSVKRVATTIVSMSDILWLQSGALSCDRFQSTDEKGHPLYTRMKVIESVSSVEIKRVAEECVQKGSTISTDVHRSYRKLKKNYTHKYQNYYESDDTEFLEWLHIIIGNAKTYIMGTYHGLDNTLLQAYLDEFCYRFNRRFNPKQLFGRLLNACAFGTHYIVPEPSA